MTAPNDGTQPTPELGQQPTPAAPELAQQQAAPAAPQNGQSAVPPSPDLAALQERLAQAEQARQLAEQQAKEHQAAFTRSQQQLKALAGVQPQSDPLAPYVDRFMKSHNMDAESAKILAELQYQNDARFQQFQQAQQAQFQVPAVIQEICRQAPALMTVQQQLAVHIQQEVARGNLDALNPEYGKTWGARLWLDAQAPGQQQAPQYSPQQPPAFGSMTAPAYGYQPQAPAQTPAVSAEALKLEQQMAQYLKLPPKQ